MRSSPSAGRPRILVLSFSRIESDARVLKQLALLADRFEVDTCGYGDRPPGAREHITIPDELQVWRWPKVLTVLRMYSRAYWSNPVIANLKTRLPVGTYDVVLANDIESVGLALALAPTAGVHADLHEYSPRQREESRRWRWFLAPLIRWMCRAFLPRAASVTTVGPRIAEEYRARFGVEAGVVRNLSPYAELSPGPVSSPLRAVHSGGAFRSRGIDILCDAIELSSSGVTLDLYLTPVEGDFVAELRARAAASSKITLHDPVRYSELVATLNGYDIGVTMLPPASFNHLYALPNKLFDYIQARIGVIVGPSPEMAQVVTDAGVGAVTAGFTAQDLAATLDGIDPADVGRWKQSADEHAHEISSQTEVGAWLTAIERILARG